MTPAGIGIRNNDGAISFVIISDNGWIKDGIGDILNRDYQNEQAVRELIENCSLPEGYDLLYNIKTQRAEEEYLFMRYCIMRPRCYIFYTYVWKNDKWYFRRLDGSGDIQLTDAIKQRIED
jgi:hypothetical protein